jgi:predicted small metal-binding protein
MPSEIGCTLMLAGEEEELINAAVQHSQTVHGHQDSSELRKRIKDSLKPESAGARSESKIRSSQKNFEQPDESRPFKGHGRLDLVNFDDGHTLGKGIFEPGWKWSVDVKPLAGTESCQAAHFGYCLKGKMTIRMDNGEELQIKAGEAFELEPGHDAWVVGNEPCEVLDFVGFSDYAVSAAEETSGGKDEQPLRKAA